MNQTATQSDRTTSVAHRLYHHLFSEDGTINDGTTNALYDEAHGLDDEEVELEVVEQWAIDTASRYGRKYNLPLNNQ